MLCTGEPIKVSLCHCLDCQRRTGSLFSVAAFFLKDQARPAGGPAKVFRRGSASGFDVDFHFCGECGSSLWWEPQRMPDRVGVAVGAFADPGFPMPEQAVWCDERHRWLELPDAIAGHDRSPARGGQGG
ncbi:GFA family protein [Sphingomonas colocasiae]|uniref:GFA family protein n=1 Tax=Sphingomonas colocasiae TaxID=1848973 RepID=UPI001FE4F996|nr:GFA family protein [Sphingomonas colocasiae]